MKQNPGEYCRRIVIALVAACLLLQMTGCAESKGASHGASETDMIEAIAQEKAAEAARKNATADTEQETGNGMPPPVVTAPELNTPSEIRPDAHLDPLPESDVDVDLTKISGTVVYARVLNLLTHPETYVGMSVRMGGAFSLYVDEQTNAHYYACIIEDATACCAQGIEFVRKGDFVYPDDYPEEGDEIVVEGTFEIYEEEGFKYIHLVDADMRLADGEGALNG